MIYVQKVFTDSVNGKDVNLYRDFYFQDWLAHSKWGWRSKRDLPLNEMVQGTLNPIKNSKIEYTARKNQIEDDYKFCMDQSTLMYTSKSSSEYHDVEKYAMRNKTINDIYQHKLDTLNRSKL